MHAPPAKPASQPPAPTRSAAPQTPVSLAKRPPSSPPLAKKPAFRDLLTRAQEREFAGPLGAASGPSADKARAAGAPDSPRGPAQPSASAAEIEARLLESRLASRVEGEVERPRRPRPLAAEGLGAELAAFRPPSAILSPPPAPVAPPGSSRAHAETAALVDRLVASLRVGTEGERARVVELRLRGAAGAEVSVRLRSESGVLDLELSGGDPQSSARLESAMRRELEARGLTVR